ncbi:dihydropteroate synthase [Alteromonas pelagimontana]|uniref:Dihydropteroate synthase n=1 Tax=Alteromonas pelagimontana TaxID=1858656 RepID=A0A6M4MGY8_9ALTE|nr:dihydropteroate synthase [Alteromonas pelagimontana]QJR82474.1 dihydropteroate synthase [Alteromonas pelagimontana]
MHFNHIDLDLQFPQVMGILNVTPDSFSDGGAHNSLDAAVLKAKAMIREGASIIDVGGESTRPGAPEITEEEELERVIPVIKRLRQETDVVISIDTSKATVMREAVAVGAGLINDVRALQEPGAMQAAVNAQVPVCLMHMKGQPRTMQQNPQYSDVVAEVIEFLQERITECVEAGISKENIILDPGFGFGKNLEHNYQLLAQLPRLIATGYPVLVGVSRKSMIGQLLNKPVGERLAGGIAIATVAAQMGAQVFRVHDVAETVDAIKIINKLRAVK